MRSLRKPSVLATEAGSKQLQMLTCQIVCTEITFELSSCEHLIR